VPTATPEPTSTASPTRRPTATLAPSSTAAAELPDPVGEPVETWNGIPVMPGALAGEDRGDAYIFIIAGTPDEVADYYVEAMSQAGWTPLGFGTSDNTSVLLIFIKETDTLSISILPHEAGAYVLIVTSG
jgi:hypothetical protein